MSLEHVTNEISANCKQFLAASKDRPVYRGIRTVDSLYGKNKGFYTPQPTNRQPADSAEDLNFMFNGMAYAAFGESNIRKRSVFATGNIGTAADYGTDCYIFPKGKFDFLWSSRIADSFDDESALFDEYRKLLMASDPKRPVNQMQVRSFFQELGEHYNPTSWLDGGKLDGKYKWMDEKKFIDDTRSNLEKLGHDYYKFSENLSDAIKARVEILFFNCEGYYAIPVASVMDPSHADIESGIYSTPYEWLLDYIN